jgi:hypothetical protein
VYWWEKGLRNPKLDNFIAIKHYAGVTPEQWQTWLREKPE